MKTALAIVAILWCTAGSAHAQSAPTCSFSAGTLTVTVDGSPATLSLNVAGAIKLNGALCTGATTTTTDTVQVNGGTLADIVTLNGNFAPGATSEAPGGSEIEFSFALGAGNNTVTVLYGNSPDDILFAAGGIDVGNDGDEDITVAGVFKTKVQTKGGDDTIDATLWGGNGYLYLYGGTGNDILYGSVFNDWLYGDADSDTLYGAAGNDYLYGGQGNDTYYGDAGIDKMFQETTADGSDAFYGGADKDTVDYGKRSVAVSVSIGNDLSDDGESGEGDFVDVDVENVTGGSGDDVLVGSGLNNTLKGNAGADELYGGTGNDVLWGGTGADILVGDAGVDTMYGEVGADSLDGGTGNDKLYGGVGNDTITGGTGADQFFGEDGDDTFVNDDGIAETVDCGAGTADDPEPSATDTFIGCELI